MGFKWLVAVPPPPPGREGGAAGPADTLVSLLESFWIQNASRGRASLAQVCHRGRFREKVRSNVAITAQNPRFDGFDPPGVGRSGSAGDRETSSLCLSPAGASDELLDCVNQSLFVLHTRKLGERLFLIYKFKPWEFYRCQYICPTVYSP